MSNNRDVMVGGIIGKGRYGRRDHRCGQRSKGIS